MCCPCWQMQVQVVAEGGWYWGLTNWRKCRPVEFIINWHCLPPTSDCPSRVPLNRRVPGALMTPAHSFATLFSSAQLWLSAALLYFLLTNSINWCCCCPFDCTLCLCRPQTIGGQLIKSIGWSVLCLTGGTAFSARSRPQQHGLPVSVCAGS